MFGVHGPANNRQGSANGNHDPDAKHVKPRATIDSPRCTDHGFYILLSCPSIGSVRGTRSWPVVQKTAHYPSQCFSQTAGYLEATNDKMCSCSLLAEHVLMDITWLHERTSIKSKPIYRLHAWKSHLTANVPGILHSHRPLEATQARYHGIRAHKSSHYHCILLSRC
jgi:hypothetical protein